MNHQVNVPSLETTLPSHRFEKRVTPLPPVSSRDEALVQLSAMKKVVHIGCTDSPFTVERLADRTMLHIALQRVATSLIGIDIDKRAVEHMRSAIGGEYVIGDICDSELASDIPAADILLAADVVEHVRDEGEFLDALARLAKRSGPACRVVVSTPNGLAFRTTVYSAFGREVIHPDHRRVHTPYTLEYVLREAGLIPQEWHGYNIVSGRSSPRRAVDVMCRLVTRARSALADGMIVVATVGTD